MLIVQLFVGSFAMMPKEAIGHLDLFSLDIDILSVSSYGLRYIDQLGSASHFFVYIVLAQYICSLGLMAVTNTRVYIFFSLTAKSKPPENVGYWASAY